MILYLCGSKFSWKFAGNCQLVSEVIETVLIGSNNCIHNGIIWKRIVFVGCSVIPAFWIVYGQSTSDEANVVVFSYFTLMWFLFCALHFHI